MNRIYESSSGGWIHWDGNVKTAYATEAQAQSALDAQTRRETIMTNKMELVTAYRSAVKALLTALDKETVGLEAEYDAMHYGIADDENELKDEDFIEDNSDLTADQFKTGIASIQTLRAAFHNGVHDSRLYPLK